MILAQAQANLIDEVTGNTPLHILAAHDDSSLSNRLQEHKCCGLLPTNEKPVKSIATEQDSVTQISNPEALLDLLLPFATESKSVVNRDGFMPW